MEIQLADYMSNSLVNGSGIRDVIFFSGCKHECEGCHNPNTWDFNFGNRVSVEYLVEKVLKNKPLIDGVTISGGDPFYQPEALLELLKMLKLMDIDIWVYTGFHYKELAEKYKEHFKYINVLVDGPFLKDLKDDNLEYCGSRNQSFYYFNKAGEVVLIERPILLQGGEVDG